MRTVDKLRILFAAASPLAGACVTASSSNTCPVAETTGLPMCVPSTSVPMCRDLPPLPSRDRWDGGAVAPWPSVDEFDGGRIFEALCPQPPAPPPARSSAFVALPPVPGGWVISSTGVPVRPAPRVAPPVLATADLPAPPPPTKTSNLPKLARTFCTAQVENGKLQGAGVFDGADGVKPAAGLPDYLVAGSAGAAGFRCRHATHVDACNAAIDAALEKPLDPRAGPERLRSRVVVQRGDVVTSLETWSELKAFLGPIDTLAEAGLVVALRGYRIECATSTGQARGQEWVVTALTGSSCGAASHVDGHVLRVGRDATITTESTVLEEAGNPNCSFGRRPAGLEAATAPAMTLGQHFAHAAELEAASVQAFDQIARELRVLGAPRDLIVRAERARADESRHARTMRRLAERFGGVPAAPRFAPPRTRSLFELALDNAVEGCVRETFGACVAVEEAEHASEPHVARALRVIARDERRHAAFSWDLARWLNGRLGAAERARLVDARREAVTALHRAYRHDVPPILAATAGVIQPSRARRLLARLAEPLVTGAWLGAA